VEGQKEDYFLLLLGFFVLFFVLSWKGLVCREEDKRSFAFLFKGVVLVKPLCTSSMSALMLLFL